MHELTYVCKINENIMPTQYELTYWHTMIDATSYSEKRRNIYLSFGREDWIDSKPIKLEVTKCLM